MEWVLTWKQLFVLLALAMWVGYAIGAAVWRRRMAVLEDDWRQQVRATGQALMQWQDRSDG